MQFTSNPLSGVHISGDNKKQNNQIVDSNGNVLLQQIGRNWSENDQIGYDILMKSMDYEYQKDLLNFQNAYNSPEQQALRMRKAGINPDLVGTTNNPSASSSASSPDTQLNEGVEQMRNIQIAQSFIQLLPQAIDIYSQMKSLGQQSTMRQIDILRGVQSLGDSEVKRQFTLDDLNSKFSMPQANLSHIKSKKLQRQVDDYIFGLVSDSNNRDYAKGLVYDKMGSAEKVRQGYLGLLGQFGYNIDDDLFVDVLHEFNSVIYGSKKNHEQYNKDYYSNISGTNDAIKHNKEVEKGTKAAANDFIPELMEKANKKIDSTDKKDQAVGVLMYILISLANNYGGMK